MGLSVKFVPTLNEKMFNLKIEDFNFNTKLRLRNSSYRDRTSRGRASAGQIGHHGSSGGVHAPRLITRFESRGRRSSSRASGAFIIGEHAGLNGDRGNHRDRRIAQQVRRRGPPTEKPREEIAGKETLGS